MNNNPAVAPQVTRPLLAIAYKLTSVVLFMMMAVLVKASAVEVPPLEAVFFRSFFALPVIVLWLIYRGELHQGLRVTRLSGHLWRGVLGTCGMIFGFTAVSLLPLPDATALGYAAPLMTVALGAWLLGERIRLFRISALALGFVGVLIVLYPKLSLGNFDAFWSDYAALGAIAALVSASFRALVQIHVRRLTRTEHSSAIVFYASLTASCIALLTIPFGWVLPSATVTFYLIGSGVIGGIAQLLLTTAYRYGETSLLAPFDYSSMLFALLLGYVIFGDIPSQELYWGAPLIIGAGIVIIWREHKLGVLQENARSKLSPQG